MKNPLEFFKADLLKMGLEEEDIHALEEMAYKVKYGQERMSDLTLLDHEELQCEPVQYPEEALTLFFSYIWRYQNFNS